MLASTALSRGSSSTYSNRVFVYEVKGLAENDRTRDRAFQIRDSGSCLYQIPFSKMNQAMRQFNRLGGTIVSIQSMEDFNAANQKPIEAEAE